MLPFEKQEKPNIRFEKQGETIMVISEDGTWVLPISPHFGLIINGTRFTPLDLKVMARKLEEVLRFGVDPEICKSCEGTPLFPNKIYIPNEGMDLCNAHPMQLTLDFCTLNP